MITDSVRELLLPGVKDLIVKKRNEIEGRGQGQLDHGSTQDTPLVKFDVVLSANLKSTAGKKPLWLQR